MQLYSTVLYNIFYHFLFNIIFWTVDYVFFMELKVHFVLYLLV